MSRANKGKRISPAEIERRSATRLARNDGVYQRKRGWRHGPETIARMMAANRAHAMPGHLNPAWDGGRSFLPYPPNFDSATKRLVWTRDRGHCRACGQRLGRGGRKPNTHHVDGTKSDCSVRNLVLLCVPCHQGIHWHARKFGEHVATATWQSLSAAFTGQRKEV